MRPQFTILLLLSLAQYTYTQVDCQGALAGYKNGCFKCKSSQNTLCYSCHGGYGNPTDAGCTACPIGTYKNGQNFGPCTDCPIGETTAGTGSLEPYYCFTPVADCNAYSAAAVCSSCAQGKTPVTGGASCVTPIADCTAQTSAMVCTACISGKNPINGGASCDTAIADCTTQTSATLCAACGSGKVLVNAGAACATPITNCTDK